MSSILIRVTYFKENFMFLKSVSIFSFAFMLTACHQSPTTISDYQSSLETDPIFKDCIAKKVRDVTEGSSILNQSITVVRCPNSTTTTHYRHDKNPSKTNIVIDGNTYVLAE